MFGWPTVRTLSVKNPDADAVPRDDVVWTDGDFIISPVTTFDRFVRLKCECGGIAFSVLSTSWKELTARCDACGTYIVVRRG